MTMNYFLIGMAMCLFGALFLGILLYKMDKHFKSKWGNE